MTRQQGRARGGAPPPRSSASVPVPTRRLVWWFGLMALSGFVFGLLLPRRPFGDDILAHPLVIYSAAVGIALLVVRFAMRRPVPEIIPERILLFGFAAGIAAFLVGNFFAVYIARL